MRQIVYMGTATSTSIMPGPADDNYRYAVDACNANGCSALANVPNTTDAEPSGGPNSIPASGGTL